MKQITPGQTWTLKPPGPDQRDLERMIEEFSHVVQGCSPFVDEIQFLNKTKHCTIDVVFSNKKMVVVFKNPADAIFDVADPTPHEVQGHGQAQALPPQPDGETVPQNTDGN